MIIINRILAFKCLSFIFIVQSQLAFSANIDAKGHYSLKAATRTAPGFDRGGGFYQGIQQNFSLDTEIRVSDKASMWTGFKLINAQRNTHLGDISRPTTCSQVIRNSQGEVISTSNSGSSSDCSGKYQDIEHPAYEPYIPRVSSAYMNYATEYCIFKAGRRPRSWGMGAFINAGTGPFDLDSSVYDGITCDVNIQKNQALGFSVGYDKLMETGFSTVEMDNSAAQNGYGPNKPSDDLDQYFFTLEYDDRKINAGSGLSQNVGFYFANIVNGHGGPRTDVKLVDLFAGFFIKDLIVKNELLFRLGKSSAPSYARLGGASSFSGNIISNKVDSIASTGIVEYIISRSGETLGPVEFNQGSLESHRVFFEYVFAPGDKEGYYKESAETISNRNNTASAIAFHRNFKPALILFNSQPNLDSLRIDGVFDPDVIMNTTMFTAGYRYESQENGNFELKLITASLNNEIPQNARTIYQNDVQRPVGYAGNNLGYELDIKYSKLIGKYVSVGIDGALALPGNAWNIYNQNNPNTSVHLQTHASIIF